MATRSGTVRQKRSASTMLVDAASAQPQLSNGAAVALSVKQEEQAENDDEKTRGELPKAQSAGEDGGGRRRLAGAARVLRPKREPPEARSTSSGVVNKRGSAGGGYDDDDEELVMTKKKKTTKASSSTVRSGGEDAAAGGKRGGAQRKPPSTPKQEETDGGAGNSSRRPLTALAARVCKAAASSGKLLGAHVSAQGGVENAVLEAYSIGCRSFALFLKNQRTWKAKEFDESSVDRFRRACEECGFTPDAILPHGSYLFNAGSPDDDALHKTREALVEEASRCDKLGIAMYNFHPGSTCGKISVAESVQRIAETINFVHERTSTVTLIVESMAGQGNTIGGTFEELKSIIDLVRDKRRVGVCLDTCHLFAAGYDIRTPSAYEKTMADFDRVVGFNWLKAVHVNDSAKGLASHVDRHANIGKGEIGLSGFALLMNDARFNGIPLILETPACSETTYGTEMVALYELEKKTKKEEENGAERVD